MGLWFPSFSVYIRLSDPIERGRRGWTVRRGRLTSSTSCSPLARRTSPRQKSTTMKARDVYSVRQTLVGAPSWTPRLHARVAVVDQTAGVAMILDLLPRYPTRVSTAFAMLSGRTVQGRVRVRQIRWPPSSRVRLAYRRVATTSTDDAALDRFSQSFDTSMHLLNNNCYTFETLCIQHLTGTPTLRN